MKAFLRTIFLLGFLVSGGLTHAQLSCQENMTASGSDSDPTSVSFTSFPCVGTGVITSITLTTANTSSNCNTWYDYTISVTHSGGIETTTGNCNVTALDLATFNGATIDVTTITDITVSSVDLDAWSDNVTVDATLDIDYSPAPVTCSDNYSATGPDSGPTFVSVNSFPCTSGGAIVAINMTTNNTSSNCNTWYDYTISVTHSGGTETTTGNCNVTALDLATFNGATIDVTTITDITVSSVDLDAWSDNVTVDVTLNVTYIPPACGAPDGLGVTATTPTTADLSWNAGIGATSYNWEVVPTGNGQGVGVVSNGNATGITTTATGLMASTTYDFYVSSDCSGSGSVWAGPYTFNTANVAPWSDNFDTHSTTTNSTFSTNGWTSNPSGTTSLFRWNIDGSGSTPSSSTGPTNGANSPSNYLYTEASSGSTGAMAEVTSPSVDISALTNPSLSFFYHMYGSAMGTLHVDIHDGTAWNMSVYSLVGQQHAAGTDPWTEATVSLSAYSGTIQVRFRGERGTSYQGDMSIDDVKIDEAPTCPKPSLLTATNMTTTSADLSWTVGGTETMWNIEYMDSNIPQGQGTVISVSTNPYTLTGLTPGKAYDFYVQADCGNGDLSDWVGPFTFVTLPGPHTIPLLEDFESGFTYFDNDLGNNVDWTISTSYFHGGAQGAHNAHTTSNENILHETGILDLSGTSDALIEFWHIAKTEGTFDKCYVEISTDNGATYTALPNAAYQGGSSDYATRGYFHEDSYSLWGTGNTTPDNASWWQKETFSLASYNVPNVRIRFRVTSDGSANRAGWYLDDILIHEPLCPNVTGITATATSPTAATVTWNAVTGATSYNWEIVPAGNAQGMGVVASGVVGGTTASTSTAALTDNTSYDVYIRSNCLAGGGNYIGPINFITPCGAISTFPYVQDFDGFPIIGSSCTTVDPLGDCWSNDTNDDSDWLVESGSTTSSNTGPTSDHTTGSGNYIYTESSSCTNNTKIVLGPEFDFDNLSNPQLFFWYHMFGGTMGSLDVEVSTDGNTWTSVWNTNGDQGNQWLEGNVDLTAYAGATSVYIRFVGITGSSYTSDMALDDISIREPDPIDVGIIDIATGSSCADENQTITVTIQNFGTNQLSSIPVSYSLNGGTPVIESWTGASTIGFGQTATYTFNTTFNSNTANSFNISAFTSLLGDNITSNDQYDAPVFVPFHNTAAVTSNYNGSDVSCAGATDGEVTISFAGETLPISYMFNGMAGSATSNSAVITGLGAGTYTYTATDASGCETSGTITIQDRPTILVSSSFSDYNGVNVSCNTGMDGEINLTVNTTDYPSVNIPVFTEDFTGGTLPTGWTNTDNGTSGQIWVFNNPKPRTINGANFDGDFAIIDSDNYGSGGSQDATLTSPAFDASVLSTVILSFDQTYRFCCSSTATVEVFDGTNWNPVYTLPNTSTNYPTAGNQSFDITTAAGGATNAQVRFTYTGSFAWYWAIDNFEIATPSTGYSYVWSNGSTDESPTGLAAGNHSVTITHATGCSETASFTLTEPTALGVLTSNTNVSCNGGTDGTATASGIGGTGNYTYAWDAAASNQTTATATSLVAGTYSVTVTDENNCTATASVTVAQPNELIAAAAVSSNHNGAAISCNGGSDGEATASGTGGTTPYTYAWSDGQTTATATGLSDGTYTATITDANGCIAVASVIVTEPNPVDANTSATANISCNGGADGEATAAPMGGTAPYTYVWSDGQTTATAIGLSDGTYSATVTDANGCTDISAVTLTEPTAIIVTTDVVSDFNGEDVSCVGAADGRAEAIATGGTAPYTYAWNNGMTVDSITGLTAGTYTVTVTDANGCTETATVTLDDPDALVATGFESIQASCNGGGDGEASVTVTGGVGPYTYLWDANANSQTTQEATNVSAGLYTVTVTDANGCTTTATANVTTPAGISLALNVTNISCFAANDGAIDLEVTGGLMPYTYQWDNGATTEDLSSLADGSYSVTITDANGCSAAASATISRPSELTLTSITATDITCAEASDGTIDLEVSGGTTPYTYQWLTQATTQDLSNVDVGTYTVTITDANGCSITAQTTVNEPAPLTANLTLTQNYHGHGVSCNGASDGGITLAANGGTTPYTYLWSNGMTTADIAGVSAGSYTVTVTDANGCTASNTMMLTEPAALSASADTALTHNGFSVSCNGGNNGTAIATPTGGVGPYTYAWDTMANSSAAPIMTATTSTANGLRAGNYTVIITDANGCTATDNVTITEPATLAATTSGTNVTCNGAANGSVSVAATGGTTPYTYSWNMGATTQGISGIGGGTYDVTITDANGCTTTASMDITEPTTLVAATTSTNISCNGAADGMVDLSVSGGTAPYSYNWNNAETSEDLSNLSAGTYTVIVTDANGCTANVTATITEPTAITALANATNVSCNGGSDGSVALTVSGGTTPYSFAWDNGTTMPSLGNVVAGTYAVTITDANGCTTNASATVTEPTMITASSSVTNTSCNGIADGAIDLTAAGGTAPYTYNWNGTFTEDLNGVAAGTYTVTITDANGCTNTHSATVTEPAALAAGGTATDVTCNGDANGSITLAVTGGSSPYSYAWSAGVAGNVGSANNLTAGSYFVTVTDANGCSTVSGFTITQPLAVDISVQGTNIACNGGSGSLSHQAVGGTTPLSVVWTDANGSTVTDPNNVGAGTYTATVTDANGCSTAKSITITEPTVLSVDNVVSTNIDCEGNGNGSIQLSVSGGTGPYSYTWSDANLPNNSAAQGLQAGNYSVTITDFNGCTVTATATINEPAALTLTMTGGDDPNDNTIANVDATVGGGTTPYTYVWTPNAGGATGPSLTGVGSGTYGVTITDANGCMITDAITVIPTNVTDINNITKVEVFPNPTNSQATINIELSKASDLGIAIYNVAGQQVAEFGHTYSTQQRHTIDVSTYAAGVYFIRFTVDGQITTKRLVVTKY